MLLPLSFVSIRKNGGRVTLTASPYVSVLRASSKVNLCRNRSRRAL